MNEGNPQLIEDILRNTRLMWLCNKAIINALNSTALKTEGNYCLLNDNYSVKFCKVLDSAYYYYLYMMLLSYDE